MGSGFQFLDIILFAMIAAFLVLRLRSVLGRRTGHQRRPDENPLARRGQQPDAEAPGNDNVIELPGRTENAGGDDAVFDGADPNDPLAAGLTQIRIADPGFDPAGFAQGARAAFEMVVQAFAEGDQKTLRNLLNDEVFGNFSEAIKQREEAGETLETTVISIKTADIIEARLDNRTAFVTVKFVSEQVNVTRDKDGEVVDGDPNRVTDVTDLWTFARNTRARDPNWTLVETRSPN
jgi:predicted lipid-binding transport protein (Tim44 family)